MDSTKQWLPFFQSFEIKLLNFSPRPGGFAQKLQARLDARIADKTINPDTLTKYFPTKTIHQMIENHLKGNTMQRIIFLFKRHITFCQS